MCSTPLRRHRLLILVLVGLLLLGACGRSSDPVAGPEPGDGTETTDPANPDASNPQVPIDTADPTDADQDGVFDGDNCPGQFNPSQIDEDGDGIGDECADADTELTFGGCSFGSALTEEARASGDGAVTTICQPTIAGDFPPELIDLGTPILITEDFVLIDLTPAELEEARSRGLETVVTDTVAGRTPADLAELRIGRDPAGALTTVDPEALAEVDPEVIGRVPAEVLATQPDRTLAAVPDGFWLNAPESTLDLVGRERLVTINPRLGGLQLRLDPLTSDRVQLDPGSAPTPTPTSSPSLTTGRASDTTRPAGTTRSTVGSDG